MGLNRSPWGGLAIALAPLPAAWVFVSYRFLAPRAWMIALLVALPCFAALGLAARPRLAVLCTRAPAVTEGELSTADDPLPRPSSMGQRITAAYHAMLNSGYSDQMLRRPMRRPEPISEANQDEAKADD